MDKSKPQGGDPLDQLAREAAEGAQFEFNPAAWNAMEAKLAPPKRVVPWWKIGGGLGAIALIIFLVFRPTGESRDVLNENGATEKNSQKIEDSRAADPKTDNKSEAIQGTNDNQAPTDQVAGTTSEQSDDNGTADENTQQGEANRNKTIQIDEKAAKPLDIDIAPNKVDDKSVTSSDNQTSKNNAAGEENGNVQEQIETNSATNSNNVTSKNSEKEGVNPPTEVNYYDLAQPNAVNDSIVKREADLDGVSFETITPEWFPPKYLFDQSIKPMTLDSGNFKTPEVDSMQLKKWSFGVMVSLDLSATGLDGFTKPGNMFGLVAEYRFADNWTIQSGLTYAVKRYSALGSEYNTSSWPGGRSDNLVRAEALCFVIDIPINLRRYFQLKNGNQWYVGGGLSTYLMLREDYDYEYTRPSPNWAPTSQVKGENNHLLGIANFSVGYETGISKKFKLGIEPFMKLPLTGIGQGEVKFLSFGTNLVIKLK
ncbi:outer membrane beta-barrel protein [Roseivirga misakiensis]|uniref:Outer membrane protein beta-barrel domain-containing protein n=1 Tax=Roseivirga misakiensis TaxID=1563681 RepID=A0A1E5T825_9BACT|nr:outer membrane beta-barrel protein [Roseivirga misakiensis]OEK07498.1 hypothetical protein BFP71_00395 [Roseivirga misakiensis]